MLTFWVRIASLGQSFAERGDHAADRPASGRYENPTTESRGCCDTRGQAATNCRAAAPAIMNRGAQIDCIASELHVGECTGRILNASDQSERRERGLSPVHSALSACTRARRCRPGPHQRSKRGLLSRRGVRRRRHQAPAHKDVFRYVVGSASMSFAR